MGERRTRQDHRALFARLQNQPGIEQVHLPPLPRKFTLRGAALFQTITTCSCLDGEDAESVRIHELNSCGTG